MYKQGKRTGLEQELRVAGGKFLAGLRQQNEITQRELAERLNLNYYTMISQIENGSARVPPNLYVEYAKALNANKLPFVQKLLEYYDPYTHNAIWDRKVTIQEIIS